MTTTLVDQVCEKTGVDRDKALTEYRKLLSRNDKPQSGDVAMLKKLIGVLGKRPDDVRTDLRTLAKADGLQATADTEDAARAESVGAAEAADKFRESAMAKIDKLQDEMATLAGDSDTASIRLDRAVKAKRALSELRRSRPDLFGGESVEAKAAQSGSALMPSQTLNMVGPVEQADNSPATPGVKKLDA